MKVLIRTDASNVIGSGHVMRCLTLADAIRRAGGQVEFVCREATGDMCNYITHQGYYVHHLGGRGRIAAETKKESEEWLGVDWQTDARQTAQLITGMEHHIDWLIVDHYALDERWEAWLRSVVDNLMVIDDLANRRHACDVLLDQNYYEAPEIRYNGLIASGCIRLFGPKYALLRPEFRAARRLRSGRSGQIKRVLISFGGLDRTNETSKAIEASAFAADSGVQFDVVVGALNPHAETIESMMALLPKSKLYCRVDNISQLMVEADLAIGAGGTTTWERAYLGLPTITIVVADNQAETSAAVAEYGAAWNLGRHQQVSPADIKRALQFAIQNPQVVKLMGQRAQQLFGEFETDGAARVARTLTELTHVAV